MDIGRAVYEAQAHTGVGGVGTPVPATFCSARSLGISREVPVGFETIQLRFDFAAPAATAEQLAALREKTEQYCVVMQTLTRPPKLLTEWGSS